MELDIFNPQVSTVAKGLEGKVILAYEEAFLSSF